MPGINHASAARAATVTVRDSSALADKQMQRINSYWRIQISSYLLLEEAFSHVRECSTTTER